jgi:hypothetical protein
MTPQEWDRVKNALNRLQQSQKELWLEKALLRNLIIDSGWMTESDLDAALERGKNRPENRQQVEKSFESSDDLLALLGFEDWNAQFE